MFLESVLLLKEKSHLSELVVITSELKSLTDNTVVVSGGPILAEGTVNV